MTQCLTTQCCSCVVAITYLYKILLPRLQEGLAALTVLGCRMWQSGKQL